MKIFTVNNKRDLAGHRFGIEALFFNCFGQRRLSDVWDWAYILNPHGEPLVSLCYDGDELVGHYAIVPMPLSNGILRQNSYLSMTTMVAESHRKFGLFTQLAQATYETAAHRGVDFVFGFPNSQSAPGFKNRLNWTLPKSDYVVKVDKAALEAALCSGVFDKVGLFGLDLRDPDVRRWRLLRPGAKYTFEGGLVLKEQNDSVDLLWWECPDSIRSLPDDKPINLLVSADSGLDPYADFAYQFGGIGLASKFEPALINREMAISDLF